MTLDLAFSAAGLLAMAGWLALLVTPLAPVWSDRIAGILLPLLLSAGYVVLIVFVPSRGGGHGSLADVTQLFSQREAVLAGWVHFLAFDLLVGAWICRIAGREGIRFRLVIPCLPLTFLFGPAGFLAFSLVRAGRGTRA